MFLWLTRVRSCNITAVFTVSYVQIIKWSRGGILLSLWTIYPMRAYRDHGTGRDARLRMRHLVEGCWAWGMGFMETVWKSFYEQWWWDRVILTRVRLSWIVVSRTARFKFAGFEVIGLTHYRPWGHPRYKFYARDNVPGSVVTLLTSKRYNLS